MMNTAYASLDCAAVCRKLEEVRKDERSLRDFLADCFFDGSVAASESAALFILREIESVSEALLISDIVKSLPTAVPKRNALALSKVSVFLCLSFDEEKCRIPLRSFCYAETSVKQFAVRAMIASITEAVCSEPERLVELLERSRNFFKEVLSSSTELFQRILVIKGLVDIACNQHAQIRNIITHFILDMQPDCIEDGMCLEAEHDFETFLTTELGTIAPDKECFSHIVRRCLVRSLEFSDPYVLQSLYVSHRSKVQEVMPQVGYDALVFVFISIAAENACKGDLVFSQEALFLVVDTLKSMNEYLWKLNPVVSIVTSLMCTAIGSLCSACGALDMVRCTGNIQALLRSETSSKKVYSQDFKSVMLKVCNVAERWKYAKSALRLGLLLKTASLWKRPKLLRIWFVEELPELVRSTKSRSTQSKANSQLAQSVSNDFNIFPRSEEVVSANPTIQKPTAKPLCQDVFPLISFASTALVGLAHGHSQIRSCAARALQSVTDRNVLLFFLPAVILRLEEETNGAIAASYLRYILLSPALLSDDITGKVAFSATLNIISPNVGQGPTPAYQTGLVAFSHAVETAPSMAMSILLREIEKLRESFGLADVQTRIAACAAILRVSKLRPARGTSFIPFISQCISMESMDIAPEAAALCFEAMLVLSQEGVLDPIKAVKIVLKIFPDTNRVNVKARRSYLRLLASSAHVADSKRSRALVEKVVRILRSCISDEENKEYSDSSFIRPQLTWEEMDAAAVSLAEYKVDDILRIEYIREEPLEDASEERARLDKIEADCMQFTHAILNAASTAQMQGINNLEGFETLLTEIVRSEWANRKRSNFDPERLAKLRATSEALRRARQPAGRGNGKDVGNVETAGSEGCVTNQFLRAIDSLPVGVIRAVCKRCATTKVEGDMAGTCDDQADARFIALKALLRGGAVSLLLPWTRVIEQLLLSRRSTGNEKASALAVLSRINDISYDTNNCQTRWFGPRSPLFQDTGLSHREIHELFVGMMLHHPQEIQVRLQRHGRSLPPTTIVVLIESTRELNTESEGFQVGLRCLLHVLCERPYQEHSVVARNDAVVRQFTTVCLSRSSNSTLENILQPSSSETFDTEDAVKAQMVSQLGHFALLRKYVVKLLYSPESVGSGVIATVGQALSQLADDQRNAIIFDLCGTADNLGDTQEERRLILAVHCLGVAALLPEAKLALTAATCVFAKGQTATIARVVNKLFAY